MNRRQFVGGLGAALAAPLVLSLEGCGGLNVTLDAITIAIDAILPFIPQVPAAAVPIIEKYLSQLTTAVEGAATELASSDTALVKTETIGKLFLGIITPDLGSLGIPANVANLIQAVAKAVQDFLAAVGVGSSPAAAQTRAKAAKAVSVKVPVISMTQAEKIISHAQATAAKIKAL